MEWNDCIHLQGPAQNRAVDGDEVALHILPPAQWHHMRGGALPSGDLFSVPASDPPLRQLRALSHSGYPPKPSSLKPRLKSCSKHGHELLQCRQPVAGIATDRAAFAKSFGEILTAHLCTAAPWGAGTATAAVACCAAALTPRRWPPSRRASWTMAPSVRKLLE